MFDGPAGEYRGQRVIQIVDGWRRPLEAEIDIPIVDAAVIDDAAVGVDGSFRRHRGAGEVDQRVFRIADHLRRAGVGERAHVFADGTGLIRRIGIHEPEQDTLRRELRREPAHVRRVAVRDRAFGAGEEKHDRLDTGRRVERIDLASVDVLHAHL
jgi:hypothetical protein